MDKKSESPFLTLPALKVSQPLGDFYVIKIQASDLLSVSFSEPMKYVDEFGNVKGSQRPKDDKRLKDIAKYIDSVEMAFPNSIILAANYTPNGVISKDESERWNIEEYPECGIHKVIIPKNVKLAAIIDGQHRIKAFDFVKKRERLSEVNLICSIYFDLPNSYQAFLFATINSNQKKVDRSLALDQFGYNVGEEPEKAWTPEKLSVFLSRKLNIDKENSPLYQHIKVAPLNPENLFKGETQNSWVVSTATIVDGISSLISSNVKRDRIEMQQEHFFSGRDRKMLSEIKDYSPLRDLFIKYNDQAIYNTVVNYFKACSSVLWSMNNNNSYILKTVGIQASFDLLKLILKNEKTASPEEIDFNKYLDAIKKIDFTDKFFQASGIGRGRIRNIMAISSGLISKEKVKKTDLPFYEELLSGRNTNTQKDKWIWEEEAENAVQNALESAEWNYNTKTVSLYLDSNYEESKKFSKYEEFIAKLAELAEIAFINNLPIDNEFAEEQREKVDFEDLVLSNLAEYEDNLKRLGWL